MNYFDELRSGASQDWISYLNKEYMELYAPIIDVFRLDKPKTQLDKPYAEALHSRIYLSPYQIRAFHLDNTWRQVLGEGTMPYLEVQENIQFIVNFDNMVNIHRELKNRHVFDLYISYNGSMTPSAEKKNNVLYIYLNNNLFTSFDLLDINHRTIRKLTSAINSLDNFSATIVGNNDLSSSMVSFEKTAFKYESLNIYSLDNTYENITEVIEAGDLVLTHKYFLYEVLSNKPGGDFGWDYATFVIDANLRSLDKAQLPGNINKIIKEREYDLRDKINLE